MGISKYIKYIFILLPALCFLLILRNFRDLNGRMDRLFQAVTELNAEQESTGHALASLETSHSELKSEVEDEFLDSGKSLTILEDSLKRLREEDDIGFRSLSEKIATLDLSASTPVITKEIPRDEKAMAVAALEVNPHDGKALLALGRICFEAEDLESAGRYLEKLTDLEPFNSEAYDLWGRICNKEGDYEKAAYLYSRLVKLEPDNALYYYNLARSLYFSAHGEDAAVNIQKSLSIDGTSVLALNLAGRIFRDNGSRDKAADYFKKSLELRSDPGTEAELGDVYSDSGRTDEALSSWTNAVNGFDSRTEEGARLIKLQYEKMARKASESGENRSLEKYFLSTEELGGDEEVFYLFICSLKEGKKNSKITGYIDDFENRYPASSHNSELASLKSQLEGA